MYDWMIFVSWQRGETALHMAARAGQVEVVRCLLRNGALVDARARVGAGAPRFSYVAL
jgi:ankyrin repeat protein